MTKPQENLTKRKASGGRRKMMRGRRIYERDDFALESVIGGAEIVKKRIRGGGVKAGLRHAEYANIIDGDTHTAKRARILKVLGNPASQDYQRRGVITKGALVDTELGRARVVSRPSQNGVVNALLMK